MVLFSILGELTFLGALVLEFYAFLSPVPWFPRDLGASLINFTPYVQPQGYTPPNPCLSPSLSNVSIGAVNTTHAARAMPADGPLLRFRRSPSKLSSKVPKIRRDATTGSNSQIAVWVGPLGTCSRDPDGSMHCTQSSYNNPQYNLSYLQLNSVFYPAMMSGEVKRKTFAALIGLNAVGFLIYLLGSGSFWLPASFSGAEWDTKGGRQAGPIIAFAFLLLSGSAQFFVNFTLSPRNIGNYNSVDNFYLPAACGSQRQLKPGLLLRASTGNSYAYMWASWCLIFLLSTFFLLYRIIWCGDKAKFDKYVESQRARKTKAKEEKETKEARKKVEKEEKAKRKAEERLQKLVEKEKVAIRAREELEAEKMVVKAERKSETVSEDSASTTVPPYSPKGNPPL